jgi:hypothetical protein
MYKSLPITSCASSVIVGICRSVRPFLPAITDSLFKGVGCIAIDILNTIIKAREIWENDKIYHGFYTICIPHSTQ